MRSPLDGALVVMLLAGAAGPARPQSAVLGTRAEVVRLDVVVTDAQGELVRNLAREDFQVLEDGKPQRITQFLLATTNSAPGREPAPAAPTPETRAEPAEGVGPGRHIVVVFDDLHIAPNNLDYAKDALKRFVDEFAAANDGVALVTTSGPGGIQQLTLDRAVLKQAIQSFTNREATVMPSQGSQMTPVQAELVLRGDQTALQLATRTLIEEPGSTFAGGRTPQAAVEAGAGFASAGTNPEEVAAAKEAQRQARGVLNEALRFSSITLGRIDDVLRSLASLPGRKICLLVSDGFLVGMATSEERTRDLRRIIDAATRSGAVVYSLDARGLVSTVTDAGTGGGVQQAGLQERVSRLAEQEFRETLQVLADDTGGFLVRGTNDLAGGLRRMLADNDAYYLMAYEPANTKRDGRFRKIEVRLSRHKDFTIRTRKGYLAPDERKRGGKPEVAAGRASASVPLPIDEAEARSALGAPIPPNGIPVRLAADYIEIPPGGPQAMVRVHVDLAGLRWQEVGGRHQAAVELLGGVYDATGNPVGAPFGKRADLDLSSGEYKRAMEAGFQYQLQVPLRPGRYEVRLVAREKKVASLGGAAQWVEIPDLGDNKLAMSGVFLSSATPGAATGSGDETFRDAHAVRRFRPGESLYFQLYVYNPRLDEKGASEVVLQAQIFSGTKVVAVSKPQAASLRAKDGVPLPETNGMPLEGIAPGRYELKVVVVDRKANATIFRRVDFTVE
jgi:VWFA-related protein